VRAFPEIPALRQASPRQRPGANWGCPSARLVRRTTRRRMPRSPARLARRHQQRAEVEGFRPLGRFLPAASWPDRGSGGSGCGCWGSNQDSHTVSRSGPGGDAEPPRRQSLRAQHGTSIEAGSAAWVVTGRKKLAIGRFAGRAELLAARDRFVHRLRRDHVEPCAGWAGRRR